MEVLEGLQRLWNGRLFVSSMICWNEASGAAHFAVIIIAVEYQWSLLSLAEASSINWQNIKLSRDSFLLI